jgi:hypothetical protein
MSDWSASFFLLLPLHTVRKNSIHQSDNLNTFIAEPSGGNDLQIPDGLYPQQVLCSIFVNFFLHDS